MKKSRLYSTSSHIYSLQALALFQHIWPFYIIPEKDEDPERVDDRSCSPAPCSVSQEWSEEESSEDDSQQPLSREDSGIQVDRTPQEDQDQADKNVSVSWTGKISAFTESPEQ